MRLYMRKLTCSLVITAVLAATPAAQAQTIDFQRVVRDAAAQTVLAAPRKERSAQANGFAQNTTARERRGIGKRILGGVVGGAAGFFAGAYTGAWIEGDRCQCDDPGLKGALIGMPIGAAIGAWAGQRWLF